MIVPIVLVTVLGLDAQASDPAPLPCPADARAGERFVEDQLGNDAAARMPPPGTVAQIFLEQKDRWIRDCPGNEYVWYSILRASELTAADGKAPLEWVQTARAAVPSSKWIETVYARSLGTVEAARAVVNRWKWHDPASVALAAAYEKEGRPRAALAILEPLLDSTYLELTVGGPLLLARVALAVGDPGLAVQAARGELHGWKRPLEPVAGKLRIEEAFAMDRLAREAGRNSGNPATRLDPRLVPPKCPAPKYYPFLDEYLGEGSGMEPPRPGDAARDFFYGERVWWQHDCPHDEVVWYAVLRASELLSKDGKADSSLLAAATLAAPRSVWIETVRARAVGTAEAAQAALQLDGSHTPAKISLAAAYERSGQPAAALEILRSIPTLGNHVGGPLLMARVALAMGETRLAAETARLEKALDSYFEPVSRLNKATEGALFAGDAWMVLGEPEKALTSFLAAAELADQRLSSPSPDLRRVMEKRFRTPGTWHYDREALRAYLGALKVREGRVAAGVRMLVQSAAHLGPSFATRALKEGNAAVRQVLEKLHGDRHISRQEREVVNMALNSH